MFFNNHNHTPYSSALCGFKDAISTTESLIDRAVELNMKGLSITEHEGVSSHLNAINYVEKGKKDGSIPEDFTLGLGNEIYLVSRNIVEEARENNGRIKFYHLILTAKDKIGHQAIRELSSMAWENSFNYRGILRRPTYKDDFVNCILKYQGHLICSTACLGSEYSELVLKYCEEETPQNKQAIIDYLNFMYRLFRDDFYIEIQPALNDEQEMYNKKAIQIAKACNIKVIITTDTHFTLAEDRLAHSIFLNSGDGDRETDLFYKYCYLQNIDEIYENLHYLPKEQINEFLNNTLELANKIESYTLAGTPFVPDAHIPEYTPLNHFKDWYDKCPYIYKFASSTHDIDRYFLYLIEKGFIEKNRTFTEDYMARIEVELEQVWEISEYLQTRLSNYYCLVLEIIEEAWKTSLVGVGRGSSGCYEILFLADLTTISGYDYGLDWWRHICKERASSGLPDIDTDFQASEKDNIVNEFLAKKYGRERILSICTFKTNGAKETILSTFRGLGLSDDKAHYLGSLLGSEKTGNWSIRDSYYGNEKKDRKPVQAFINEVDKYKEYNLLDIMLKLEGIVVGRSAHAAAVVLYQNHYCENSSAMMKTAKGQYTTQFEMRNTEQSGLVKMDCLVIEALDRMRACMNMLLEDGLMKWKGSLKETFNYYLHPTKIDMDNKDMIKLLYTTKNMSFFQMESVVGEQALLQVKPKNFIEACSVNALMRLSLPGGVEQPLQKYIRFRDSNCKEWYDEMREQGLNEEEMDILKGVLSVTYGICDTQEKLMILSREVSNFDLIQMNVARKSIAKKSGEALEKFKKMFFEQGLEIGRRQVFLDYVWKYCFSPQFGYSFSDPHIFAS